MSIHFVQCAASSCTKVYNKHNHVNMCMCILSRVLGRVVDGDCSLSLASADCLHSLDEPSIEYAIYQEVYAYMYLV